MTFNENAAEERNLDLELSPANLSTDSETTPPREGFIFYFSFYDAIKKLPIRIQLKAVEIIIEYARSNIIPEDLPNRIEGIFILIKPQIDANERKRKNGYKGKNYGIKGAEYGENGGRPSKKQANSSNKDDDFPA